MAGHLLRAGHDLVVWNRTVSKSESLRDQGATVASSLADLAPRCDVVMTCVGRSEDVDECIAAMAPTARPNTLFVDHSTIAPAAAIEIGTSLARAGLRFVDAPITGGSVGAQKGQLTIFCGGSPSDVEQAMPILAVYAKRAERVGDLGSGQSMKLANQIAVGGALLALCECMAFVKKAGLDAVQAREMIGGGAAASWAFENYGPKIIAQDWTPGFSVKNQRKDFEYCKAAAREIGAAIPGTELVDSLLARLQESGHEEWTTAAMFEVLTQMGVRT